MGILILLPIYFVEVRGFETLEACIAMIPFVAIMSLSSWFIERILKRIDYFVLLFIGYLLVIIGFTLLINIAADLHMKYLFIMMSVSGMGLGMIWVTSNEMSKASTSQKQLSIKNGLFVLARTIGGAIGMALFLFITLSFFHYFLSVVVNEGINKVENSTMSTAAKSAVIEQLQKGQAPLFNHVKITDFTQLHGEVAVFAITEEMNHLAKDYLVKAMAKAFFAGLMINCIFLFLLPFVRLEENAQKLMFEKGRSI